MEYGGGREGAEKERGERKMRERQRGRDTHTERERKRGLERELERKRERGVVGGEGRQREMDRRTDHCIRFYLDDEEDNS